VGQLPTPLHAELAILAPRILIAIGRDTWEVVKHVLDVEGTDYGGAFWRGMAPLSDGQVEIFFVNHPAYDHWRRSFPELLDSLRRHPPTLHSTPSADPGG
jgi:hypothetical protein